jgi:HEAT repeat protein
MAGRPADRAAILAAFIKGLGHPSPRVRYECAHALDAYGDVSCREPLIALIDDPVPRVRRMAMHALSCDACGESLFGDDDLLRRRIADRALRDESVQVRRHAVVALAGAGGAIARAALQAALADADAAVRRNAAWGLRRLAA